MSADSPFTLDGLRYQTLSKSLSGGIVHPSEKLFIPSLHLELDSDGRCRICDTPMDSVGIDTAQNDLLWDDKHRDGDMKVLERQLDLIRSEKLLDPTEYRPVKVNSAPLMAIHALQTELNGDTTTELRSQQIKQIQRTQIENLFYLMIHLEK